MMTSREAEATPTNPRSSDLIVILIANLMNLIMVLVFLSRTELIPDTQVASWIWALFSLVLLAAAVLNLRAKREWWASALPALLALFLVVEIVLDYVLQFDFRSTRWLGPYLLLYYLSILGMVGYSFLAGKKYGVITLLTYFLSQIAALYSYFTVGHG
jgi:hypothetical protein